MTFAQPLATQSAKEAGLRVQDDNGRYVDLQVNYAKRERERERLRGGVAVEVGRC